MNKTLIMTFAMICLAFTAFAQNTDSVLDVETFDSLLYMHKPGHIEVYTRNMAFKYRYLIEYDTMMIPLSCFVDAQSQDVIIASKCTVHIASFFPLPRYVNHYQRTMLVFRSIRGTGRYSVVHDDLDKDRINFNSGWGILILIYCLLVSAFAMTLIIFILTTITCHFFEFVDPTPLDFPAKYILGLFIGGYPLFPVCLWLLERIVPDLNTFILAVVMATAIPSFAYLVYLLSQMRKNPKKQK